MTRPPDDDPFADPFAEGQADAETLRRVLEDAREDVEALVRQEVGRVGMSRSEVERMVQEAVAREARRPAPGASGSRPPWVVPAVGGAALVVGLLGGVLGYRALSAGDAADPGALASAPAGDPAAGPATPAQGAAVDDATSEASAPPPTPAERAAMYDSLFAAGSDRLAPLVDRLEAAGPVAAVATALEAWRAGGDLSGEPARRLHDALVQMSLNEVADAGLTLDGRLTRGPCGGNSCGALLELWRARGEELGLPALPADPATDAEALAVAERALIMGRLEEGGGG